MNNYDLSILIPARNEEFLSRTVDDILKQKRGNTEVIVVLDGAWASPPLADHPDLTIVHHNQSVGQRAATNEAARLSSAKYVMKVDAHCTFDEGFDVKMMAEMRDDWTMVPVMYNLHVFDWVCFTCGYREDQGPQPAKCPQCGDVMAREIIWKPRWHKQSMFYRFDKTLHFQYWGAFKQRPEAQGDIAETMSLQGSCFMMTRQKYWELDICDEKHGSWGQQGVEVACKTWLSGGRVVVNKKTWYSHLFRTQEGFGFPYPNPGVEKARAYSRKLFLEGQWKGKYDLQWLLDKFYPVPDWHDGNTAVEVTTGASPSKKYKGPTKGIIFYTDNQLNLTIARAVQKNLQGISSRHKLPIVSASLKPMSFGTNVYIPRKRGYVTMARQILSALEASTADIIYFCEHDVLYHPTHFSFSPPSRNIYYYNTNVWRTRSSDGHALFCDNLQQLSGLCAWRDTLLEHFRKRMVIMEEKEADLDEHEFNKFVRQMGFEPGTHNRPERVDDLKAESYFAEYPNIDIRHDSNLTPSRWNKDQFVNEKYTQGWKEVDSVSPWNWKPGKFVEFLKSI